MTYKSKSAEYQREYYKEYRKRPDVVERQKNYMRKYRSEHLNKPKGKKQEFCASCLHGGEHCYTKPVCIRCWELYQETGIKTGFQRRKNHA